MRTLNRLSVAPGTAMVTGKGLAGEDTGAFFAASRQAAPRPG